MSFRRHPYLTVPEGQGPFPAVLLVVGSGDGDRDGNSKKGKLFPNMYKDLAEFISDLGLVTLRVDKRGVGESGGNLLETGMVDLVDDIESNIAYLEKHPKVTKIILLGHSEGCTLITAANARHPVEGYIIHNMDHLLKEVSEEASVLNAIKDYKKNQNKPLHPELKQLLSEWFRRQDFIS